MITQTLVLQAGEEHLDTGIQAGDDHPDTGITGWRRTPRYWYYRLEMIAQTLVLQAREEHLDTGITGWRRTIQPTP